MLVLDPYFILFFINFEQTNWELWFFSLFFLPKYGPTIHYTLVTQPVIKKIDTVQYLFYNPVKLFSLLKKGNYHYHVHSKMVTTFLLPVLVFEDGAVIQM